MESVDQILLSGAGLLLLFLKGQKRHLFFNGAIHMTRSSTRERDKNETNTPMFHWGRRRSPSAAILHCILKNDVPLLIHAIKDAYKEPSVLDANQHSTMYQFLCLGHIFWGCCFWNIRAFHLIQGCSCFLCTVHHCCWWNLINSTSSGRCIKVRLQFYVEQNNTVKVHPEKEFSSQKKVDEIRSITCRIFNINHNEKQPFISKCITPMYVTRNLRIIGLSFTIFIGDLKKLWRMPHTAPTAISFSWSKSSIHPLSTAVSTSFTKYSKKKRSSPTISPNNTKWRQGCDFTLNLSKCPIQFYYQEQYLCLSSNKPAVARNTHLP